MLIALGVCGGIGAYKAVEIARALQQSGHDVVAVMTRAATQFVGPLTFEAITRRRVVVDQFEPGANADIEHIAIASSIDLLLVAPATANTIARFAHGLADDALSTLFTATQAPVVLAPAMNSQMWRHPAVRENLETLVRRGAHVVEPGSGYLACGWTGPGRLAEPDEITSAVERVLRPSTALVGRRVLVSAGPTYEDLDPVRFIGNRSSGRMGFAIADEATRRGAAVTLIAGPTSLEPPAVSSLVRIRSAEQLHDAVLSRSSDMDVVIMAAAVADYAPVGRADAKITKSEGPMVLELRRTPDVLAELGRVRRDRGQGPVLVGFAAETSDAVRKAAEKRTRKHVDLIVANDVSRPDAGFEVETNAVTLVSADGATDVPRQSKARVAGVILDAVERLLQGKTPSAV